MTMPLPENDITTPDGAACFNLMMRFAGWNISAVAGVLLIRLVWWCCTY